MESWSMLTSPCTLAPSLPPRRQRYPAGGRTTTQERKKQERSVDLVHRHFRRRLQPRVANQCKYTAYNAMQVKPTHRRAPRPGQDLARRLHGPPTELGGGERSTAAQPSSRAASRTSTSSAYLHRTAPGAGKSTTSASQPAASVKTWVDRDPSCNHGLRSSHLAALGSVTALVLWTTH
jgi:hypothetical protein